MVSITSAFCFSLFVLLKYPSFFCSSAVLDTSIRSTDLLAPSSTVLSPLWFAFAHFQRLWKHPRKKHELSSSQNNYKFTLSLFYWSDLLRNWLCSMKTTLCLCFKKLLFNYVLFVKRWMANEKAESPDSKVVVMFIKF